MAVENEEPVALTFNGVVLTVLPTSSAADVLAEYATAVAAKSTGKRYLGDSVYAEDAGHGIVLTTENGYGPSNRIFLEPEVLDALIRFGALARATMRR